MPSIPDLPTLQPCLAITHAWWQAHLPIGVCSVCLALVGVIVPWWKGDKATRTQRAIWSAFMFILLFLELQAIHEDQIQHGKEEPLARCEQLHSFREIAKGIDTAISNGQEQFRETMKGVNKTLSAATQTVEQTKHHSELRYIAIYPTQHYGGPNGPLIPTPIVAEHSYRMDVLYSNAGNETAEIYGYMAETFIGKPDDVDSQEEIAKTFEADWKAKALERSPHPPLSAGVPRYFSFSTKILSVDELQQIKEEKMTVYYLVRISYSDRTGKWFSDYCSNLQVPASSFAGIQHPCLTGDKSRYPAKS